MKGILNEEESYMESLQTAIEQIDEKIDGTETLVPDQEAKELLLTITALNKELKENSENLFFPSANLVSISSC